MVTSSTTNDKEIVHNPHAPGGLRPGTWIAHFLMKTGVYSFCLLVKLLFFPTATNVSVFTNRDTKDGA